MKTAIILGKHRTIIDYPKDFHKGFDSFGINHIAYDYNTDYAFANHDPVYKYFIQQKIPISKIIMCSPTNEGTIHKRIHDTIGFDRVDMVENTYKYAERTREHFVRYIEAAILQKPILYPNYFSCLHSLMYYLIKKEYDTIFLTGCNNTKEGIEYWQKIYGVPSDSMFAYVRENMFKLIEVAKEYNINFIYCEDYTDFLTKLHKLNQNLNIVLSL